MQNDSSKLSDLQIIQQVLSGHVDAFESLLIRYRVPVLRIVKKRVPFNDVEETAHEIFIRAYKSLSTFKENSEFKQWLFSIAIRACYDYWRKAYRYREVPMSSLTDRHRLWLEETISDRSEQSDCGKGREKEAGELLDWALQRLSPEERTVLELVYLEGLSGREAADLLGWSVANVKVRSFRSRKKLEKILKDSLKK